MWWMVGGQKFFQLEIFHHTQPAQRPQPANWRPSDHGWVRFGVSVTDYESCIAVLDKQHITRLGGEGIADGLRRTAFLDPFIGVVVEVMERARTDNIQGCAIAYVTSSVSDLPSARQFYGNTLGFEIADLAQLHQPSDEALWGLAGAKRDGFLVHAGDALLEIVRYADPVGRPRAENYQISDQGIMNIAMGSREKADVAAALTRIREAGFVPPFTYDQGGIMCGYITAREREIEFTSVPKEFDAILGFAPSNDFMS